MKKIFLLDDNVEFIEIIELILGKDYIIFSKLDRNNLSKEILDFNPDLMLIDLFLGNSNSGELTEDIRATIPGFSIPFILFSASPDIAKHAKALGAAGFIEKPASIAHIKNYIKGFFENANQ